MTNNTLNLKHLKIIIFLFLFFLSLFLHARGLNLEGRTWDEEYKVETGRIAFRNILQQKWDFASWGYAHEHPMLAKYLYGLAATMHYYDIDIRDTRYEIRDNNQLINIRKVESGYKVIDYDWTWPRILSAAFNSATVALTFFIASFFVSLPLSTLTSIVLLTTPRFLGLGRLITFESLSGFLFLLTIIFASRLIRQKKLLDYFFTALFSACLFWTRYNNIYIYLFLAGCFFLLDKKTKKAVSNKKLFLFPLVFLVLGIFCWPLWWLNFPKGLLLTFTSHQGRPITSSFYYLKYFFLTTPLVWLILFCLGIFFLLLKKDKTVWEKIILWQVVSLFVFFTLVCSPTGGTRYIFLIYPSYALICALGLQMILQGWGRTLFFATWGQKGPPRSQKMKSFPKPFRLAVLLSLLILFFYNVFRMVELHPYYLDYYNELSGGLKGAKQKNLEISWWGEGQREAGIWLNNNIQQKSTVALCLTPKFVFPPLNNNFQALACKEYRKADILVVGYNDQKSIPNLREWKRIYAVEREEVELITIYKKIQKAKGKRQNFNSKFKIIKKKV